MLGFIGKKHVELMRRWMPSAAVFGGTFASLGVYITEWRLIAEYIPFYGGKFEGLPPAE